jgi:hypothetical protein
MCVYFARVRAAFLVFHRYPQAIPIDLCQHTSDNDPSFMRAYLSGSIEYAPDLGKGWRSQITPYLRALGHEVYDPAADEKKNLSDEEVLEFRAWKTSNLERFQATVRKIIAWDLDWIEQRSDYVVCYWDAAAARGAGTQGELTFAHRAGIPVYLVLGMPVAFVSGWILGCATQVFDGFKELQEFLARTYAQRYSVNVAKECEAITTPRPELLEAES